MAFNDSDISTFWVYIAPFKIVKRLPDVSETSTANSDFHTLANRHEQILHGNHTLHLVLSLGVGSHFSTS